MESISTATLREFGKDDISYLAAAVTYYAFFSVFPFALGTLIRGGLAAGKSTLPFGPFLAFGGLVILIVPRLIGLGA